MTTELAVSRFRQDFVATVRVQACLLLFGVPLILGLWVWAAHQFDLDVRLASRSALMCCAPLALYTILYPLFTKHPDRKTIFITAWFLIAMFFNIWWEMPQVLFMSVFQEANQNLTLENLVYFIPWWGYTTSDLDYFNLSRYFILAEMSFWVVNLLAIIGLYHKYKNRELRAMIWFFVCGALQVYNVTCIFIPYGGIVEQFQNVATDSVLAVAAYWIMNLMWVLAALLATVFAYSRVFELTTNETGGGAAEIN
jgi:hypothetical protein